MIDMSTTFKHTDNMEDAFKIREAVFMVEQGFKNEFEDKDSDPRMIHLTAYIDGDLAGCARVFPSIMEDGLEAEDGLWIFGRLAVLPRFRKQGLGSSILNEAESVALENGASSVALHAQCNAQHFYSKNGYDAFGPIEFDEHVEHQWMRKSLV